jgi:thymidylate synthase (FAD)
VEKQKIMRLLKPSAVIEFIEPRESLLKRIESYGRTCYKSEGKATHDSAPKFCEGICQIKKHESVIEHAVATVRLVIDRGVSHECVRHRLSSFSQESTRYVNYSGDKSGGHCQFIIPPWLAVPQGDFNLEIYDDSSEGIFASVQLFDPTPDTLVPVYMYRGDSKEASWLRAMHYAEREYHYQTTTLKQAPQEARDVLPNSTKTELVWTCNLRQWRTVFKLRTATTAHPQMREVMRPLLDEFKKHLPEFYGDITYEDKQA